MAEDKAGDTKKNLNTTLKSAVERIGALNLGVRQEVRLHHWAKFGTSVFIHKNRPFDL